MTLASLYICSFIFSAVSALKNSRAAIYCDIEEDIKERTFFSSHFLSQQHVSFIYFLIKVDFVINQELHVECLLSHPIRSVVFFPFFFFPLTFLFYFSIFLLFLLIFHLFFQVLSLLLFSSFLYFFLFPSLGFFLNDKY